MCSAMTIGVVCAAASGAFAQVGGEASWLWEVTTQDGDSLVEPGETATIKLSINFDPDVTPGGPVQGLAGAIWDTVGGLNASAGTITGWEVLSNLDDLTGDTTTTDGVSLFASTAAQGGQVYNHDDPIDVLSFEWKSDDYTDFVVEYTTITTLHDPADHLIFVWEGDDPWFADAIAWPIDEAMVSFQVIPAPASALLIGIAGLGAARRGRR